MCFLLYQSVWWYSLSTACHPWHARPHDIVVSVVEPHSSHLNLLAVKFIQANLIQLNVQVAEEVEAILFCSVSA